jgi:glutamate formiminotransferase
MRLVECVPNFSEGRDRGIVDAIVAAIKQHPIHVLDVSLDADHHRSVVTFVGEPQPVEEAAFSAIMTAAELIDLTVHQGVHPRIGAADVVPFIPLRNISLSECAAVAERLGQRVGEAGLPVYLYEAAARRMERRNLADVRRGGYEALRGEISLRARLPDFGPAVLGKAGAVAIGARAPLIAFNVYLNTDDVEIARDIARAVRTSDGGLPHVKALGLRVNGMAQVSMNLTDFRVTSLYQAVNAVRSHAARHGVEIASSELIGLIPQSALLDYALESLLLPPDTKAKILETAVGVATGDYRPIIFE